MSRFFIREVRLGRATPFGPEGQPSAIDKKRADGDVLATPEGLVGDEQGDTRHHGGKDKAIHAYAAAHYQSWAADMPDHVNRFTPGAFGENFVVDGVTEADICLLDHWLVGNVLLEVSQGRQPCWKLNVRFGRADMARQVQTSGRTGWYFRVLMPGVVHEGATARLVSRTNPNWPLTRVSQLLYHDTMDRESLAELVALADLPQNWRQLAERRLASGAVENWTTRLETPAPHTT